MALLTAAQAREVGIPTLSGTGADTMLDEWISRADSALAAALNYPVPAASPRQTMESASYVLYLTGFTAHPRRLDLGGLTRHRVTAITSVYDDPDLDWDAASLVASGDYTLRASEGDIILSSSSTHGRWTADPEGAIKVALTAGWTSSTVPLEVRQAIGLLVAHWIRLRSEQGHTSVAASSVSIGTRDETIPESVMQLVRPYAILWGPL